MSAPRSGRQKPRSHEARANYVYLIKRSDGSDGLDSLIKVGVSKNVRNRRSHLANASPEKLSILKTIKPGRGLAFHIETAVKFLLRPFCVRGEWFKCSEALAMLALRAAEHGELECRACVAMEIERQKLIQDPLELELEAFSVRNGFEDTPWTALTREMLKRFPEFMHEADPWAKATLDAMKLEPKARNTSWNGRLETYQSIHD